MAVWILFHALRLLFVDHPGSGIFVSEHGETLLVDGDGALSWEPAGTASSSAVYFGQALRSENLTFEYVTMPSAHVLLGTKMRWSKSYDTIEIEWAKARAASVVVPVSTVFVRSL